MSIETDSATLLLIRANKLELVERLADDLAHEIKNPLHSMVINLEVLRRRLDRAGGEHRDDLLRYAGVLSGELDRVNQRIDLLLRLTRPDRGSESATVNEVLVELRELLEMEGRHHEVEVRFDLEAQVIRIAIPREPLRQVILNLVLAALDLLPGGSALRLRTRQINERALLFVERLDERGEVIPLDGAADVAARALAVTRAVAEEIGSLVEADSDGALVLAHPEPA